MTSTRYELRRYVVADGKRDELFERFRRHTVRLLERHGIEPVGFWTSVEEPDVLVYLVRHTREPAQAWADFGADAQWQAVRASSVAAGPLIEEVTSELLEPAGISADG